MSKIDWRTQETILNPKLLDMIPKLNSWLPPQFIQEIHSQVQVYLEYKDDWFPMEDFEVLDAKESYNPAYDFYLKNTKTTAFDVVLFCSAWKRNPETVEASKVEKWAKKVGDIFGFNPVWDDTHSGLSEINDMYIIPAINYLNNPKPQLYEGFKRPNILTFMPKEFFIIPFQKYPFMNFWETPFPEKKNITTTKNKKGVDLDELWNDFFS